MARLEPERTGQGPLVQGFSGPGFRVDGRRYEAGLLLTPEAALGWIAPSIDRLSVDDLSPLLTLSLAPEFLLLGTGTELSTLR